MLSSRPDVIENAITEYHRNLFAHKRHGSDSQLADYLAVMPRLSDEIKERLEEPISVAEIEKAIDELPAKKSLGPDGVTAAFYEKYKHATTKHLHPVITEAYETKQLPPSFLNTHTILVPKEDDEYKLKIIKNYRPIALRNVDYKVLMKVLARR